MGSLVLDEQLPRGSAANAGHWQDGERRGPGAVPASGVRWRCLRGVSQGGVWGRISHASSGRLVPCRRRYAPVDLVHVIALYLLLVERGRLHSELIQFLEAIWPVWMHSDQLS